MTLVSKEHYELLDHFERILNFKTKLERESKENWKHNAFFCNGEINAQFLVFRAGYALAKHIYQD